MKSFFSTFVALSFLFFHHCLATEDIGFKSQKRKLSKAELTVNGIILGSDNLNDVLKLYKGSKLVKHGDAAKSVSSICLRNSINNVFLVYAAGEVSNETIMSATLMSVLHPDFNLKDCTAHKIDNPSIFKLKLNMEEEAMLKMLGKPQKHDQNEYIYVFNSEFKFKAKTYINQSSVTIDFKDKRASVVQLVHLELMD